MNIREVPRSEWRAFLDDFSRDHCAWLGTIHGLVGGAPVTHLPSIALKSVTLESDPLDPVLRIRFVSGVSLCAAQPRVMRVQMEQGAERALEVETAGDGFIRLAFRATALPEELDSLAPGEAIGETPSHR